MSEGIGLLRRDDHPPQRWLELGTFNVHAVPASGTRRGTRNPRPDSGTTEGPTHAGPSLIRIIVPPGTSRPLAAIRTATLASLRAGRVAITTTFAGTATLEVRSRAGRRVARIQAPIAAGETELVLPARPPAGDLRLRLIVRDGAGHTAISRAAVTTERTLSLQRAGRLVRAVIDNDSEVDEGGGFWTEMRRCRRVSATRIDCQLIAVEGFVGQPEKRRCTEVAIVRLRADGARMVRRAGAAPSSTSASS